MNSKMKLLGAVVLTALGVTACSKGAASDAPAVATAVASVGNLSVTVEANGTVTPVDTVQVKSKASGEVLQLLADVGDSVVPGKLLARIDPRDVNSAYQQALANLKLAKAQLANDKLVLDRAKDLLAHGVITQQQYDADNLTYVGDQAGLVKAQSIYSLDSLELGDVTIVSPIRGTVIERFVGVGSVIQSGSSGFSGGTTLFTVANLDSMQIVTQVDETDIGKVKPGQTATVKVDAYPNRTFEGIVKKIDPQSVSVQNVTMFNVVVSLDNQSRLLLPGMDGDVTILAGQAKRVLLVPNGALVDPRDVGPTAMALGMNPDSLPFGRLGRGGRGGRSGAGGRVAMAGDSRSGGASRGGAPGDGSAAKGAQADAPRSFGADLPDSVRAQMDSLRAKVARGAISQDSMRSFFRSMRARMGGSGGEASGNGPAGETSTRPAVVFVMNNGKPAVRSIRVGLNNWDSTEVVQGLQAGDTIAVVGGLQLQAQQQAFENRIRSRRGGMFGG